MGEMSFVGNDFLDDRKAPHQLTMPDVEIRVVDGVPVVSYSPSRVVHRIAGYRGVHHNNLQHLHGCNHGLRHSGDHRGTTFRLCLDGGGGVDIIKTGIHRRQKCRAQTKEMINLYQP